MFYKMDCVGEVRNVGHKIPHIASYRNVYSTKAFKNSMVSEVFSFLQPTNNLAGAATSVAIAE